MSRGSKINYRNKAYTSVWSATLKCSNSSRKTHGSKQKLILNVDQDIVIVSVANIVYIYTEFGVTRVYLNDGNWATANVSLLQLYASLDPNMFLALTDRQLSMWNILTASPISDRGNSEYICIPRLKLWKSLSLRTEKKIGGCVIVPK